jgi:hypothetical protein
MPPNLDPLRDEVSLGIERLFRPLRLAADRLDRVRERFQLVLVAPLLRYDGWLTHIFVHAALTPIRKPFDDTRHHLSTRP